DIGIRMPDKRRRVRDLHAAKPDVIAGPEPMGVETGAGTNVEKRGQREFLRGDKIVGCREFDVGLLACNRRDRHSSLFGEGDVVSYFFTPKLPVRCQDCSKNEALRGLRPAQIVARY